MRIREFMERYWRLEIAIVCAVVIGYLIYSFF